MKIQQFKPVRQPLTPEQQDQKLREVGELYEKQFLREMMKQMRSTIDDGGGMLPTSSAEKIFREQLDQEYVEKWGDRGGLGLADVIHQQLREKFGAMLGLRQDAKPMGPIKIDAKSQLNNPLKIQNGQASSPTRPGKTTIQYDLQKAALGDNEVTSPWSGTLTGIKKLNADENVLELAHDNGLKSQLVFRGQIEKVMEKDLQPSKLQVGAEIQAGQRLGLLSPEAKSFFWTVDATDSL